MLDAAPQASIPFGPVPSRRLGRSLGINNIPPKHCSYSCVYCQVGPTPEREIVRRAFHPTGSVARAVAERVAACRACGEAIDYLSFVPDGEPTLDANLGRELDALAPLGIRRAVITNGSLLWHPEVRADLARAELVSVKVDADDEATWRRIDRPDGRLSWQRVRDGMLDFAAGYRAELLTETMLVDGVNDGEAALEATADLVAALAPARAFVAVPTRPPADSAAQPASADAVAHAVAAFEARGLVVERLVEPEQGHLGLAGDPVEALLAILAVHPLPEAVAADQLVAAGADRRRLDALIARGAVERTPFGSQTFLVRPRPRRPPGPAGTESKGAAS